MSKSNCGIRIRLSGAAPFSGPAPACPCEATDNPESLLGDGARSLQLGLLVARDNGALSSVLFFFSLSENLPFLTSEIWNSAVKIKILRSI